VRKILTRPPEPPPSTTRSYSYEWLPMEEEAMVEGVAAAVEDFTVCFAPPFK